MLQQVQTLPGSRRSFARRKGAGAARLRQLHFRAQPAQREEAESGATRLRRAPGVTAVTLDPIMGWVTVSYDPSQASPAALQRCWAPLPRRKRPGLAAARSAALRQLPLLIRLGLALVTRG